VDTEQFWKLLEPIHPQAGNFCRRLAGNDDDGDDLYQETLCIAIRKFHALKDLDAFKGWLYRIAVNVFKNWKRSPSNRIQSLTPEMIFDLAGDDPREKLDARMILESAFGVLSSADKALVVLYEIEGWSVRELAFMFNKPEGTIKARLSRARKKMRKKLERLIAKGKKNRSGSEEGYGLQKSQTASE